MLTIYAIPVSLYCAKLRILMRHKRLEWRELPPPGGYGSAEYETLVPSGNLPTLVDGDLQIADSEAIAEYLEEKYPDPPMLPPDPAQRAKVRERSRFHDTRLEPELRKMFPLIGAAERDPSRVTRQARAIAVKLRQLAALLEADRGRGETRLTLGDCGYPVTLTWIDALQPVLDFEVEMPRAVAEYRAALGRLVAVDTELGEYRPRLAAWLAAQ